MRLRRSPLLASAALLVGLTGAGCLHGTRYTPRRDGTARLVMQVNKLAVYKDGETIKLEDKPARLLRCSRRAAADTARGAELWASGERLARVSATLAALGVGAPAIIPIGLT